MLEMSEKQLRLSEATNKTKTGEDSIFILDPLLTLVSAQCQVDGMSKDVFNNIERMERVCALNGTPDGTHLLLSAYNMKSIIYIRQEKVKEAQELLEKTYNT